MHAQKYMRYDASKINGRPSAVSGRKVNRFVRRKLKQLLICDIKQVADDEYADALDIAESFGQQDYIDYLASIQSAANRYLEREDAMGWTYSADGYGYDTALRATHLEMSEEILSELINARPY